MDGSLNLRVRAGQAPSTSLVMHLRLSVIYEVTRACGSDVPGVCKDSIQTRELKPASSASRRSSFWSIHGIVHTMCRWSRPLPDISRTQAYLKAERCVCKAGRCFRKAARSCLRLSDCRLMLASVGVVWPRGISRVMKALQVTEFRRAYAALLTRSAQRWQKRNRLQYAYINAPVWTLTSSKLLN